MKKLWAITLILAVMTSCFVGCVAKKFDLKTDYPDAKIIKLDGDKATIDGAEAEKFDYTWHCDPSVAHDEVKNAPAEYYTGTKPETEAAAYIDSELYYYPLLDESKFKLQNYDGEREWTYYYTDGEHNDYIFATLPNLGNKLPTDMMHSEAEAAQNKVLHITKSGTYALSGEWKGQVLIDLGDEDETFTDKEAKVTLILNGVDITCTVAPAIVFRSAYECDNAWEDRDEHSAEVDTADAGVNVIIADETDNNIEGENIYRMLKTVYKDEDSDDAVKVQKKMRKVDAAFYSYVSMNIGGKGVLNITSGFEGLDSELHMSINDGNITVNSQDDGINVNEDNVSVIAINGGNLTLNAANGAEGDGIDSNGYITINGGTVSINGVVAPDSAMDSEDGIYYNDGKVIIDGKEQSYTAGSSFRETGRSGGGMGGDKNFEGRLDMPNEENFDLEEFKKSVSELDDDATLNDVLDLLGMNSFRGERPDKAGEQEPPQKPNE